MLHSLAALQVIWQVGPDVGADKLVGSLDFADFNGHFRAVASNGVVFTTLNSFLTPLVDTWYYIGVGFDSSAIGMTIWDTTHQIESISVGLVQPGYNTIVNPDLGVMAAPNGVRNMVSGGRVDSLGIWPNTAIPSLGPVWNNGQAIEYNALPAAFLPPKLQLWANFNEASGSATYLDSTGGGDLVAHGGGLTRQVGAGF